MSTEYVLWNDGPITLSAVESSSQLSIDIFDEREDEVFRSVECLTSDNILEIVIKLLEAASYISEDPELTMARLLKAVEKHSNYLAGMPLFEVIMDVERG